MTDKKYRLLMRGWLRPFSPEEKWYPTTWRHWSFCLQMIQDYKLKTPFNSVSKLC